MDKKYVICPYCNKKLKFINNSHLKFHNKTIEDLKKEFPYLSIISSNMKNKLLKGSFKNKKSINYIKKYIIKNKIPYKIISKEYKNSYTKLKWQCENGHIFFMTWSSFQQGIRCFECFGSKKKTLNEINNLINNSNYKWISGKYKNIHSKLKLQCNRNHIYTTRFDQFQQKHRCPYCHYEDNIIKFSGTGNPNWRGGISFEPYCNLWTKELKQFIKNRDKNICLNPCCKSLNKTNLVIHHINYNKKDCDQYNLITLCNTCNATANFNREWHKNWYQAIIYKRYFSNKRRK